MKPALLTAIHDSSKSGGRHKGVARILMFTSIQCSPAEILMPSTIVLEGGDFGDA